MSDQSAGSIKGQTYIKMSIKITNDSTSNVDLSQVIVTLKFGPGSTVASPVYPDSTTSDFFGTVKPGGVQSGEYAFAIPAQPMASTLYVDIDGNHQPAVIQGKFPL
ncbi:hypothetical protein AS189_16555 [Arthrobacter alpinus]|uniref:Uncharacterized protein n=1 Tax=Arthrobacter alpinus TaxID=656366 RepID=A0A0S2M1Z6_9MICC|nr:hypothetical protein AS189_16555 [Arthrobacter alpinus]